MDDLRKRFGRLLARHRKVSGLNQAQLAERAALSVDMIARAEAGGTGVSFAAVERLAAALGIDPAELFASEMPAGTIRRRPLTDLSARLSALSDSDLAWVTNVIDAALRPRG